MKNKGYKSHFPVTDLEDEGRNIAEDQLVRDREDIRQAQDTHTVVGLDVHTEVVLDET